MIRNSKLRAYVLRILENLQNERPDKVIYLNILNTGFIIDSIMVRNKIISVIRRILK